MALYLALRVLKFAAVLAFSGGFVAAFVSADLRERRLAVHGIASPALVLVWVTGYGLCRYLGVPLIEIWTFGGLAFSTASLLALIYCVARDRRNAASFCAALLPLVITLGLMVFKPTWATIRSLR